jgi:hypothetical protein
MSSFDAVNELFDGLQSSFRSELERYRRTSGYAALWRDLDESSMSEMSESLLDRWRVGYEEHEDSRVRLRCLRAHALDMYRSSGSMLDKIDELLSVDASGPVMAVDEDQKDSRLICRHIFESALDGDACASNWALNSRARAELRRVVPVSGNNDGIPIPIGERFRFGSTFLYGWELPALYDALIRVPEALEASCDDDLESSDAAFYKAVSLSCRPEDVDEDEFVEAPSHWRRLVVPSSSSSSADDDNEDEDDDDDQPVVAHRPSTRNVELARKHMKSVLVDLSKVCVRPQPGKMPAERVSKKIAQNVVKRRDSLLNPRKRRKCKWLQSGGGGPGDFACSPWFFRLDLAEKSHPGLIEDVTRLCACLGYSVAACMKERHVMKTVVLRGIVLESWTLEHRYCLENLVRAYSSDTFAYRRVRSFDNDTLLRLSCLIRPDGHFARSSGSEYKSRCDSVSKKYFGTPWFGSRYQVWTWPRMATLELYGAIHPLLSTFHCAGMNADKEAYVSLYESPEAPFAQDVQRVSRLSGSSSESRESVFARVCEHVNFLELKFDLESPVQGGGVMERDSDDDWDLED